MAEFSDRGRALGSRVWDQPKQEEVNRENIRVGQARAGGETDEVAGREACGLGVPLDLGGI